jgi:CheY-like chemotaxis protein
MTTSSDRDLVAIFVVEDHPTTLAGIHSILERFGPSIQVTDFETLQAARAALKSHKPHLLVLDLQLPETLGDSASTETGIQFLRN